MKRPIRPNGWLLSRHPARPGARHDVSVKLQSTVYLLCALTIAAPDARRLANLFLLGRQEHRMHPHLVALRRQLAPAVCQR